MTDRRPSLRRLLAVYAMAYALAFAGLVSSFGSAAALAGSLFPDPFTALCSPEGGSHGAPPADHHDPKSCALACVLTCASASAAGSHGAGVSDAFTLPPARDSRPISAGLRPSPPAQAAVPGPIGARAPPDLSRFV